MIKRFNLISKKSMIMMVILFIAAGIYSCSSAGELKEDSAGTEKTKVFSFSTNEDGQDVQYKVEFRDGEIVALQRDGENIKKEDFDKYSDLVNDELSEINRGIPHLRHFDAFTVPFDTQGFSERMRHFSDKLADLKDIDIHIDKDWGKDYDFFIEDFMNPDDFHVDVEDININIDLDAISSEMKKAAEEIKKGMEEIKKIDFPDLKREMLKIKKEIKEAHKDMKHSASDLRKLKNFTKELKAEMVKDKLISSIEEDVSLRIEEGEFYVNDKKVDDNLAEKYKTMYKEKFGHDMNRRVKIKVK